MAKAFGKFKRLIRKAPNGKKVQEEEGSLSSTPVTLTKTTEEPTDGTTELVGGSEKDASAEVAIVEKKEEEERDTAVPQSTSLTDADDVLDGILQDLNIKVGQLAVNANQSSDAVSEYSGGSAKSVESSDDSEDDDDEEDEDDDGEAKKSKDKASKKKKKKNTPKSVSDRVAIVVAAAEEIRKQRGSPVTVTTEPNSTEGASTSSNPAAVSVEPAVTSSTAATEPVGFKKSRSSIASSGKKSPMMTAAIGAAKMARKSPITTGLSKQALDVARKSPITTLLPKMSKNKSTSRSTSPQFSPPATDGKGNAVDPAGAVTTDNMKSFSSSSKNDTDKDVVEVANTKDANEVSDDGGEGSTSFEEGTFDVEDNTLGENTLGTDGDPTLSMEGDSTLFDEDASQEFTKGDVKTKKTVMNKDIIIHQPGGASSLVVRAMYYTPLPATPEDIIIKVEVSLLFLLMIML